MGIEFAFEKNLWNTVVVCSLLGLFLIQVSQAGGGLTSTYSEMKVASTAIDLRQNDIH